MRGRVDAAGAGAVAAAGADLHTRAAGGGLALGAGGDEACTFPASTGSAHDLASFAAGGFTADAVDAEPGLAGAGRWHRRRAAEPGRARAGRGGRVRNAASAGASGRLLSVPPSVRGPSAASNVPTPNSGLFPVQASCASRTIAKRRFRRGDGAGHGRCPRRIDRWAASLQRPGAGAAHSCVTATDCDRCRVWPVAPAVSLPVAPSMAYTRRLVPLTTSR